jgi:predicted amidohydrolase
MAALVLISDRVRWCESEGVDILCCPEAVLGGLADDAQCPADFAIDAGQLDALLAPLASKSVTAIVGFTETAGAGKLCNAAAVFHGGRVFGIYSKRHPAIRRSVYSAGDQSPVFTVGTLSFGIMICNDSNDPTLAADMAAHGASVIFVPSNNSLPPERADVVALTRAVDIARARDNAVMIARADVAGGTADRVSFGSSAIVDARGTVLRMGEALKEDILVAEINNPLLRWRRIKLFRHSAFARPEFFPQRLVLRLELREALAHRRQRRVDLRFGEALRNMLRAIPVEGVEVE